MSTQLQPNDPLYRLQQFLVGLKVVISLLRDVFIEFKDLLVVWAMIAVFVLGLIELFHRLHG